MTKQCGPTLVETLDLSRSILADNSQLAVIELNLSINQVLEYPNVRSVFKGEASIIGFSVVRVLTQRFLSSFGFSTKLEDSQLDVLTFDILENFENESLQDIILFFKLARSGKLGVTKKGVDSNLIIGEWFPKYLEFKSEERERQYNKKKSEEFNELMSVYDVKKAYAKLTGDTFREKVLRYIDKITEGINREQLEVLITEWSYDEKKKPYLRDLKAKRLIIK